MYPFVLLLFLSFSLIHAQKQGGDRPLRPIIFLHGMLASGDTYSDQAVRFMQQGWDEDQLVLFDWNTLGQSGVLARLRDTIDRYAALSFDQKVHLVGHSAGTNICYRYLNDSAQAAKVHSYVHLAGSARKAAAGKEAGVKMLNIYSAGDPIVPGDSILGAENLRLEEQDHYQVATSHETFAAMRTFFQGADTGMRTIEKKKKVKQSGKAVRLGSNESMERAGLQIYALDEEQGQRESSDAVYTGRVTASGQWGPVLLRAGCTYEYVLRPATGPAIHYIRRADSVDQPFVYLRALPRPESPAGRLLSALPASDSVGMVAIFSSRQAVVARRDRLEIDRRPLATSDWAKAEKSHIAWFLYDANGNGQSDQNAISNFAWAPFLQGIDHHFSRESVTTHTVTLNHQSLTFSTRPLQEGGIVVLML